MKKFSSNYEYAKFYLAQGFSVIPTIPEAKSPAISWGEFQKRKPTDDELKAWFASGKNYGIAIVTGEISGLAVVDFDDPEAYQKAQEQGIVTTPVVKTAKGYHAYYRYSDGVRNSVKKIPGVDIRGEGGCIIAPPSKHPSGVEYTWEDGIHIGDIPLADLPTIYLSTKPEQAPVKTSNILAGATEGSRNDSLAKFAGLCASQNCSLDEALSSALIWNERNQPPLSEDEVKRTVQSIYNTHARNHPELSNALPTVKKGKEIMAMEISVEWLIENLLPKESITILSGRGGIGKTWLSMQIGGAVSQGTPFMGLPTQMAEVYYIDFENSLPVVKDRLEKIQAGEVNFLHSGLGVPPPKLDKPQWKNYFSVCRPGSLLIFDTLRASQSMDENDSKEMASIMMKLKELRDRGHTILLLHHTPKANDQMVKGSSAIIDLSDHVLSLHTINKQGNEQDGDTDGNKTYYFGVNGKTRYKPFNIFLTFDPERTFIPLEDPDFEKLRLIRNHLMEHGPLNQSNLREFIAVSFNISGTGAQRKLLMKGESKFFTTQKKGNTVIYEALSDFPPIYREENEKVPVDNVIPIEITKNEETCETDEDDVIDVEEILYEVPRSEAS